MQRDFFGGTIRLHILHHAAEGEVFGQWLMDELAGHGYRLSPGTLYPILHSLETLGYLRCRTRHVDGRMRRMYRASPSGKTALVASRQKVFALLEELVGEAHGATSVALYALKRTKSKR